MGTRPQHPGPGSDSGGGATRADGQTTSIGHALAFWLTGRLKSQPVLCGRVNRRIPSCRTAKQATRREGGRGRGEGLRACAALHCSALPRTEPRHPLSEATNHITDVQ